MTTVIFRADCCYEIAFLVPTDNAPIDDMMGLRFGVTQPLMRERGVSLSATFDVTHIEHADIDLGVVAIFEWPSQQAIEEDGGWRTARYAQNRTLGDVNVVYAATEVDTTVTFEPNGVYEFAGFWMNRENAALMATYFERMGSVVQAAAPRPLVPFKVASARLPDAMRPDRFNFLEWTKGRAPRDAMFTSDEFKNAGYLRALALDRLLTVMVAPRR